MYSPAASAGTHARRAGEEAEAVDDRRDLIAHHRVVGLPQLSASSSGERLRLGFDPIGERSSRLERAAGVMSTVSPEGRDRRSDGRFDLVDRRFRQTEQRLARPRVQDLFGRFRSPRRNPRQSASWREGQRSSQDSCGDRVEPVVRRMKQDDFLTRTSRGRRRPLRTAIGPSMPRAIRRRIARDEAPAMD